MSQVQRISLAFLAGCAIVWLVPVAVALVAALPGWASVITFARAHALPLFLVSPVLMGYVPSVLVIVMVGVVVFRLGGARLPLFVSVAAPPVLVGLYQNITLLWPINPIGVALQTPDVWLGAITVVAALAVAMLLTKATRGAA
jgi:hypothetical protein